MTTIKTLKQLIKYLEHSKEHYTDLANYMFFKKDCDMKYFYEHFGKTKYIDLLLFKLKKDDI